MKRLLIIGAGGHGRVVADTAQACGNWNEVAFLDDRFPQLTRSGSWMVVDDTARLENYPPREWELLVAIGDNPSRLEYLYIGLEAGYDSPVLIHPSAWVSPTAELGDGCVVFAGAVINVDAHLGRGCIVNTAATVDHDCRLSDGVHISPGAHLGGEVEIGLSSWVGVGASLCNGIKIGRNVVVGAGGVVVEDVKDGLTVVGVPAKPKRLGRQNG